eukprot:285927-Pyramimonas_sp.AAC.1
MAPEGGGVRKKRTMPSSGTTVRRTLNIIKRTSNKEGGGRNREEVQSGVKQEQRHQECPCK